MFILAGALTLGACSSLPERAAEPLPYFMPQPVSAAPLPARAALYADCIAQAGAARTIDVEPAEPGYLRLGCSGGPARALFDALGDWQADKRTEQAQGAVAVRYTSVMRRNPFGLDRCWRDAGGAAPTYGCTLTFRAGEFLYE
jgi:hypothetical protein